MAVAPTEEWVGRRLLIGTTVWWAKQQGAPRAQLRCVHKVPLDKPCSVCADLAP